MPTRAQKQNPQQLVNAHQSLHQTLGQPTGRVNEKKAALSSQPVHLDSDFSARQRTFFDTSTGEFVTIQEGTHFFLACGCRITSPQEIAGVCYSCSRLARKGHWKHTRLVCRHHTLCIRCGQKQIRAEQGGGPIKKLLLFLLTIILWPLFDRIDNDEQ